MTGYGKASGNLASKNITVEIRSLNSKQLDLNIRVPQSYKEKEAEVRNWAGKEIERGRADLTITFGNEAEEASFSISESQVTKYFNELEKLSTNLGSSADILSIVMRLPDVIQPKKDELTPEEWEQVQGILNEAAQKFNEFRTKEGASLAADLKTRIDLIKDYCAKVEALEPVRAETVKKKLATALEENFSQNVNKERLEQEIIYYLEKLDITEERVRLLTHCEYFLETMSHEVSEGRKLGFISQEIGREINTMGAKANNADIQRFVVQMKDELEKIKEQVSNVL